MRHGALGLLNHLPLMVGSKCAIVIRHGQADVHSLHTGSLDICSSLECSLLNVQRV